MKARLFTDMADPNTEENTSNGLETLMNSRPFNAEVTASHFYDIETARSNLETARHIFDHYDERPAVGSLLQELVLSDATPPEARLEGYQQFLELISRQGELRTNMILAEQLIDTFRMETNPGLRMRLGAMIVNHADPVAFARDHADDDGRLTNEEGYNHVAAVNLALSYMAAAEGVSSRYRTYAKLFLEPSAMLQLYAKLHDFDQDLKITPRIVQQFAEETDQESQIIEPLEEELTFSGNVVLLRPPYLPSLEKIEAFQKETGRALPLFAVRHGSSLEPDPKNRNPKRLIRVEFTPDLSKIARDEWVLPNRRDEIGKQEVFTNAWNQLLGNFLDRLPEGQSAQLKDAIAHGNLELWFSTERSITAPPIVADSDDQVIQIVPPPDYVPHQHAAA